MRRALRLDYHDSSTTTPSRKLRRQPPLDIDMLDTLSAAQIQRYEDTGFCVIDQLLSPAELAEWRAAVDEAVAVQLSWTPEERDRMRADHAAFHNQEPEREERSHYAEVFVQCVNLWKTTPRMRQLILNPALGKIAAEASQCGGIHLYHDHVLAKPPWAPATNWHLDNGGDPFHSVNQVILWIGLDDANVANGCVQIVEQSHKHAGFPQENDIQATFAQDRGSAGLGSTTIAGCLPQFPEWDGLPIGYGEVKAGGAVLLSGMVAHSAGPNMSFDRRRAMCFVFMPEGATKNANHGAMPDCVAERVGEGELLVDETHLPLLWSATTPTNYAAASYDFVLEDGQAAKL